jgi:hypothetical protein
VRRGQEIISATGKLAHYHRAGDTQAIEDYPPAKVV